MPAAALLVEATLTADNQWTATTSFRGRVNVYVEDTVAAGGSQWNGWVHLQRQFQKADNTWTPWETIEAYNAPGTHVFVEHENGVNYRLGVPTGAALTGGGQPYVRISQ